MHSCGVQGDVGRLCACVIDGSPSRRGGMTAAKPPAWRNTKMGTPRSQGIDWDIARLDGGIFPGASRRVAEPLIEVPLEREPEAEEPPPSAQDGLYPPDWREFTQPEITIPVPVEVRKSAPVSHPVQVSRPVSI